MVIDIGDYCSITVHWSVLTILTLYMKSMSHKSQNMWVYS